MKKKFLLRVSLIATATILSVLFFLPSTSAVSSLPDWLKNYGITLGLDLQGGVHLVYEVDTEKTVDITTERMASSLANTFKEKKVDARAEKQGQDVVVSPDNEQVKKIVQEQFPALSIDKQSEGKAFYRINSNEVNRIKTFAIDQALETIRNRVDQFGVAEPTIHRQATNEIVIQLPGVKDTKRAIDLVGKTALLEFKLLDDEAPLAAQLPGTIPPGQEENILNQYAAQIPEGDEILFGKVRSQETQAEMKTVYLVKKQTLLTGDFLTEARVSIDQRFNEPYVSLSFDATGAKIFEQITANNIKKRLAIILDSNVHSAPAIQDRIAGGNAQITGTFTMDEAKDLAIVLRSGSLPAPLKMLQNVTVGPSLGKDSIDAGIKAGVIGALLVIVFMIVYYKMSGVIADFALVLNIVFLLGALAAFKATLTMPGIAGIILAIGMAVDSNVLMFERMRDELRLGKTPRAAIDSGYDKAFWTIFDSHVTTLITAVVLYEFGTGPIKGFAVTLGVGVLINLFTALIGTKTVFDLITTKRDIKRLSI
ncbi:MAG: protein translocase subunit SecD [Nitrospirae bacterium]|nr:protein translocase subunit SecD [Nitrospirota bacterium]MBI4849990.1 protein translocase subunit SecD [Nitrospirota bacterium]